MAKSRLETSWDAIVVGAGLGGLAAGARLARAGLRVLILDQHFYAGGFAHHFPRKHKETGGRYFFDVALHQTGDLKPGRPMHRLLSGLGVLEHLTLMQMDEAYRSRWPRHDLRIPADADAYQRVLADAFPHARSGIRDLFAILARIDDQGPESPDALQLLNLSLDGFLRQFTDDDELIAVFAQLWGYLGLPPSRMSAFLFAQMWNSFHHGGCFYFRGGGMALSNAFVDVIREAGSEVRLRTPVTEITVTAGRVTGVSTAQGELLRAPLVISNAAPPMTFGALLASTELDPGYRYQVETIEHSISICEAYLGIDGDAASIGLSEHEYFVNPTYDIEAEWRSIRAGIYRGGSLVLANNSVVNRGQCPPGKSIIRSALLADGRFWCGRPEPEYRRMKNELTEYFLSQFERHIPDVRRRIEICEVGTPHTMWRYSWNPLGAIYGYANSTDAHSVFRPAPKTPIPGLFLAGAWTFPSGGFEGAMASGDNTAKLIFDEIEGPGHRTD